MKRMLFLALLALALPISMFASSNSVDLTDSGGTLTGGNTGLSLSGSTLIAVNGLNGLGLVTGNLGTVSFSTGAFLTGDSQHGGTFGSGGTFVVTSNGSNGLPSGTLFNGSFTCGTCSWALTTEANGTHTYTLTGTITGTWINGTTVEGTAVQLTVNTGKNLFNGSVTLSSGDINVSTVPEPGTLGLLGTGLIGLVGVLRRKFKS